jgi:predicted short-subunit dehydrogenase-like oxidoreductase (DUF2520 family)
LKGRTKTRRSNPDVAIIGPGRVGQAMGKLLVGVGVPIRFVAARTLRAARQGARFIGSGEPIGMDDARLREADILLLTTSDAALAEVSRELAARFPKGWSGKVVLHTCGSLPSSVLNPLKQRGAAIGSLHPYQTIPSPAAGVRNLPGGYWAIEGDRAAQTLARRWVRLLGGVAFPIRRAHKVLYHLSAFLTCPTVTTLMAESTSLLKKAGVPERVSRPMLARFVRETASNFQRLGPKPALTGPAVRGDWLIIERHLAALGRVSPEFLPVYRTLLAAMLRLGGKRPPRDLKLDS